MRSSAKDKLIISSEPIIDSDFHGGGAEASRIQEHEAAALSVFAKSKEMVDAQGSLNDQRRCIEKTNRRLVENLGQAIRRRPLKHAAAMIGIVGLAVIAGSFGPWRSVFPSPVSIKETGQREPIDTSRSEKPTGEADAPASSDLAREGAFNNPPPATIASMTEGQLVSWSPPLGSIREPTSAAPTPAGERANALQKECKAQAKTAAISVKPVQREDVRIRSEIEPPLRPMRPAGISAVSGRSATSVAPRMHQAKSAQDAKASSNPLQAAASSAPMPPVRPAFASANTAATPISLVSPQLSDRTQPPQIANKSRAKAVTGVARSKATRSRKADSGSMRSAGAESEAPQPALTGKAQSDETDPQPNPASAEPVQLIERAANSLTSTVADVVEPWLVSWWQR